MTNWLTNTTCSYCLRKSHMCHIASFLLLHVLKMSASNTNASARRRWRHSQTAR